MQKVFLLLPVLLFFACAPKQKEPSENVSTKSEKITGSTEIEFNEDIHDFGNLVSGEIVIFTFTLTNVGKHNLIIENINTDCGCVQTKFSKNAVKPGETGNIEVEFDSSGLFGNQFKSIEIYANTKELKHLAIFAEVKNEQLEIKF